jgi:aminotransferase
VRKPVRHFGTSPFAGFVVDARSDVIDVARINPDLPPPSVAVEAVERAIRATPYRYPDDVTDESLREAVARFYLDEYAVELDPGLEIVAVPGTRFAIMALAAIIAQPGDRVVLPDPGYPDYLAATEAVGAVAMPLPLHPITCQPQWEAVDRVRPAMIYLNYPSNPCGVCSEPGTFERAVRYAQSAECWLVQDLAYGPFQSRETPVRSVLQVPESKSRAVELWSASKAFSLAGWRIGVVVGNAELVGLVSDFVEMHLAAVWQGFQVGFASALNDGRDDMWRNAAAYRTRQTTLTAEIESAGYQCVPPNGGLSIWCAPPAEVNASRLATEFGVATASGDIFGRRGNGRLRISVSIPESLIPEVGRRLRGAAGTSSTMPSIDGH